jgi:Holliday junction DNA helicase RuvA
MWKDGTCMYSYIIGKIISTNKKTITFENNYIGYSLLVPDSADFEVGRVRKLYIYKNFCISNKNKIVEEIYGFEKFEQKEVFLKLLNVSGIGPKTAIGIVANDAQVLKNAVACKDIDALCALKNITPKYARLIIENLHECMLDGTVNNNTNELIKALKNLGYEQIEIEEALKNVSITDKCDLSELISKAIRFIATGEGNECGL